MPEPKRKERRHDIDWLRNLGILLLFPFHTARVFDIWEPNYAKNAVWTAGLALFGSHEGLSSALSLFLTYTSYWFMPLLFWVAGASAWYSLKSRSPSQFGRERVRRLLIPFVFGLLFLVPPQGYMAKLAQGFTGGYLNYLAGYFTDFSDMSGYYGTFTPAHLWFILYLIVLSFASLPLFMAIRRQVLAARDGGRQWAVTTWLSKPAFFLLLFIPLTLTEALPDIGGKNPFYYLAILLLGYLAACDSGMQAMINRLRVYCLGALPVLLAAYTVMIFSWEGLPDFSWQQISLAFLRNFLLICTLTTILGYANKYLNRNAKALPYMNRAAFPVYILHQSVLIVVAYFVVMLSIGLWIKFALILVLSFAFTLGIYELLVRRIGFMSFLFGCRAEEKKAQAGTQSQTATPK